MVEQLSELTKESFYCLRGPSPLSESAESATCLVECKRKDGKLLGAGCEDVPDGEASRRAFAFSCAASPETPISEPCLVHVHEVPFSYGKLGGTVWKAALGMGQYLALNPSIVKNKRVLELGAGVGLPGLVASKVGAKYVTLTEFGFEGEIDGPVVEATEGDSNRLLPSALLTNLKRNVRLNHCQDCVTVKHLDWYDFLPGRRRTGHVLDREESCEEFDLIIGSDLINWEDDAVPLVATLKHFLSSASSGGEAKAIIAQSKENRRGNPRFLQLLREQFVQVGVEEWSIIQYDEHPFLLITVSS